MTRKSRKTAAPLTIHFSSDKEDWGTPPDLFNALHREFPFATDVCAHADNAKLPNYYDKSIDALKQNWTGVCWMNPPYGRSIHKWVKKAYESAMAGATVVCLVPARTDTRWWQNYCTRAAEIRFIKGRLKFTADRGKQEASAPFPSAVVIFTPNPPEQQAQKWMLRSKKYRVGWWLSIALRANRPLRHGPPSEAERAINVLGYSKQQAASSPPDAPVEVESQCTNDIQGGNAYKHDSTTSKPKRRQKTSASKIAPVKRL